MPSTMRAIEIAAPGGPDVLRIAQRARPVPKPGEILIDVIAAGVNRPDLAQRAGLYPPPPDASDLPGLEVAGRVAALGEGVTHWQVGDEVCALTNGGGYAEFVATPAGQALPRPRELAWHEAAAIPETFFTVWTNVFDRGRLRAGETFLVHGGSSGIGTTAIQLAHAFGARVFTTVGNAQKAAICKTLGAELAIEYRDADFVAAVRAATDGRGVDLILDMVGGDYLGRNVDALAPDGRLVQIATMRGRSAPLDLAAMMTKRLTLTGSTLRPRSAADKAAIAAALRERVWPLLESGRVKPVIHARFPLERAADAHRALEAGEHVGKIVLDVGPT